MGNAYTRRCNCCTSTTPGGASICKNTTPASTCATTKYLTYDAVGCLQEVTPPIAPRKTRIVCGLDAAVAIDTVALRAAQTCSGGGGGGPITSTVLFSNGIPPLSPLLSQPQTFNVTAAPGCIYLISRSARPVGDTYNANTGNVDNVRFAPPNISGTGPLGSATNIYTLYNPSNNLEEQMWWIPATGAGAATITLSELAPPTFRNSTHIAYQIRQVCGVDTANPFLQVANVNTVQNTSIAESHVVFPTTVTNPIVGGLTGRHAFDPPDTNMYISPVSSPTGFRADIGINATIIGDGFNTRPYDACNAIAVTGFSATPATDFYARVVRDPGLADQVTFWFAELKPAAATGGGVCVSTLTDTDCIITACNTNTCANGILPVAADDLVSVSGAQFTYQLASGNLWRLSLLVDGVVRRTVELTPTSQSRVLAFPDLTFLSNVPVPSGACVTHNFTWQVEFVDYAANAVNALTFNGYQSLVTLEPL